MTLSDSEKARKLNVAVKDIKNAFTGRYGATRVWEPDSQQYRDSIRHSLGSSNREPAIVVEPDNAEDAATLLKVIAKHRVRFAIMGGGHATCPRFSSTKGVHISMRRLNSVEFLQNSRLVRAGAGCTWDEVYMALDKKKRIVVGGTSNKGVGIAGYLLGGGYSMKTNQYGLGINNVTEFQVALPNGKLVVANKSENTDLFEALRGGGNNFGIVTSFTIKTHPARNTYGAILTYKLSEAKKVKAAILKFDKKEILKFNKKEQDRTQSIVAAFRHVRGRGDKIISRIVVTCLWNGKKSRGSNMNDLFKNFKKIEGGNGRGLWKTRPLGWGRAENSVVPYKMGPREEAPRGRFGCTMVFALNKEIVDEVEKQAKRYSRKIRKNSGIMVLIDVWPFLPDIFSKSSPKTRSAWPPRPDPSKKVKSFFPILAYFQWKDKKYDGFWIRQMQAALNAIGEVAKRTRATAPGAPMYSNTSLEKVKGQEVYRDGLEWLTRVKKEYDPQNVMSLTGGFKIPLKVRRK